jgi:transposase
VLARRQVRARAWELGGLLEWAAAGGRCRFRVGDGRVRAGRAPVAGAGQLAAERGLALVCVPPLLACRSGEGEDLARDRPGPKGAVLIARLASELRW